GSSTAPVAMRPRVASVGITHFLIFPSYKIASTKNSFVASYKHPIRPLSARHLLRAFDGEVGCLGGGCFAGLGSADRDAIATRSDGADAFVVDLRERTRVKG